MSRAASHDHASRAAAFVANDQRTHWHDQALWFVRSKRDMAAHGVAEWERLREDAAQIKRHTLARLSEYLEQFEREARQRGAHVHWAPTAEDHNRIVLDILRDRAAHRVVKSKSMLTEECELNAHLIDNGIEVVDTDLGERIVQLRGEPPSHIVLPAIHITKEEVGETFHRHLGTEAGASDPTYLAEAARGHLRRNFLRADAGITGVNFAIAETGGLVVCTNEGNADLGVSLPSLHIACMGIEKLIPRVEHLGVFLRLLARSATGQPITAYTSHFHGPMPGGELHIVLVDNGRSGIRSQPKFFDALRCIRCGACMNTCPVYRRSGGYSYGATIPGPIGSVLHPLRDTARHASLPYACSLCGSCSDVCPVQIPLHAQLLAMRGEVAERGDLAWSKRFLMKCTSLVLRHTWLYRAAGGAVRWVVPRLPRRLVYNRWNIWGKNRELPDMPRRSFRALYRRRHGS